MKPAPRPPRPVPTTPYDVDAEVARAGREVLGLCLVVFGAFAIVAWLTGCGGGLSDTDKENLHNAATLEAMAYSHADAGTPFAALTRGAFCASAAVLRSQRLDQVDAGIACK